MKFFFDNQLSPHLAASIHELAKADGHEVTHLRGKFKPDTPDIEWIPALGKEGGWIVICGDLNITRTRAERQVWKNAGLTGFFLKRGWMSLTPWDQAWRLVKWWPAIVKQADMANPGSTFGVGLNVNGKFDTL